MSDIGENHGGIERTGLVLRFLFLSLLSNSFLVYSSFGVRLGFVHFLHFLAPLSYSYTCQRVRVCVKISVSVKTGGAHPPTHFFFFFFLNLGPYLHVVLNGTTFLPPIFICVLSFIFFGNLLWTGLCRNNYLFRFFYTLGWYFCFCSSGCQKPGAVIAVRGWFGWYIHTTMYMYLVGYIDYHSRQSYRRFRMNECSWLVIHSFHSNSGGVECQV